LLFKQFKAFSGHKGKKRGQKLMSVHPANVARATCFLLVPLRLDE